MFCPNCGKQLLLTGQKFCAHCGGDLNILAEDAQPAASSAPVAVPEPGPVIPSLVGAGPIPTPASILTPARVNKPDELPIQSSSKARPEPAPASQSKPSPASSSEPSAAAAVGLAGRSWRGPLLVLAGIALVLAIASVGYLIVGRSGSGSDSGSSEMQSVVTPSHPSEGGTTWAIQFKNPNATASEVAAVLDSQGITDADVSEDASHYFTIHSNRVDLFPQPTPLPTPLTASSASAPTGPSDSLAPTPTSTQFFNSVDQNGKACQLSIPSSGTLGKLAKAFEADPRLGQITCTRGPIVGAGLVAGLLQG
jgi:hypothetical protein